MKFGLHFMLSCAEDQTPAQLYREALEQACCAEALGFESVWPVEHHFDQHVSCLSCPSMLLAAIAARTTRLRLGTAIVQLPLTHPLRVAEELATLDVLSQGRVDFGVGRGANPVHFAGFEVPMGESRARFEENLTVVQHALLGERFSYAGKHVQVHDLSISPRSLQRSRMPIRVAANSAETLEWAGRHGHAILLATHVHPLSRLAELLPLYHRARAEARHAPATPDDITMLMPFFVGSSRAQVERQLQATLARFVHLISTSLLPALERCDVPAEKARLKLLVDQMLAIDFARLNQGMGILDTPEACVARLQRLQTDFGVGRVIGWFNPGGLVPHEQVLASMRLLANHVLPHFCVAVR